MIGKIRCFTQTNSLPQHSCGTLCVSNHGVSKANVTEFELVPHFELTWLTSHMSVSRQFQRFSPTFSCKRIKLQLRRPIRVFQIFLGRMARLCQLIVVFFGEVNIKHHQTQHIKVHPGRLTWNLQINTNHHLERKITFQTSMMMFQPLIFKGVTN